MDDLSAILTAERNEAARNPHRSSTTRARAEEQFDEHGGEWRTCDQGGCWHWRNEVPCPPDPWSQPLEVAS